jgi:hypothetical protein
MNTKLTPPPVRTPMQSENGLSHAWHVWFNEIKDYLAIGSFTPSAHTQDWNTITNTPATYPPSAHNQAWGTITGIPSSFTPSAHATTHAPSAADTVFPAVAAGWLHSTAGGALAWTTPTYTDVGAAPATHYHSSLMASDGSPNPALSMNAAGYGEFSNGANDNLVSIVAINNNATLSFQTDYGSTSIIQGGSTYASHGGANSLNFVNANATPFTFYQGATQRLIIDGIGNVGIGRVPEAWYSSYNALQIGGTIAIMAAKAESAGDYLYLCNNMYFDGSWKRMINDEATYCSLGNGNFIWYSDAASAADVGFTPTERMRLSATGNLGIGTAAPYTILELSRSGTAKANLDLLTLTNTVNAADMDGTGTSILFRQYYYDAITPAVNDLGRITFSTVNDWVTPTTSNRSGFAISSVQGGALADVLTYTLRGTNKCALDLVSIYSNGTFTANHMTAFDLSSNKQIGRFATNSGTSNGMILSGFRSSYRPITIAGYSTAESSTICNIELNAYLYDGSTGVKAYAATSNILTVNNNTQRVFDLFGDGTLHLSNSTTAHPMTDIAPTDVFGRFSSDSTLSGLHIDGFSDLGTTGLTLTGYFSSVCSGYAAVVVNAYISNGGTGVEAVPNTHRLFAVTNASTELLNIAGNGSTCVGSSITSARFAVDDSCGFVTVDGYAGLAVKTTCAENLVKGQVVSWDPLNNYRVVRTPANGDMPMGIAWADTTSGGTLWVIQAGYAWVQMKSGVTATRGDIVYMSNTIGVADTSNTIPSVTLHNREIGHCVATSSSGGLALCTLHFN